MATMVYSVEAFVGGASDGKLFYPFKAEAVNGGRVLKKNGVASVVKEHVVKVRPLKDKLCSLLNNDDWEDGSTVIWEHALPAKKAA